MPRDDLVLQLKALQPRLAAEGVSHLALFGSRARVDQSPASDVDILLDVVPESGFSLTDLIGIEHLVESATGFAANAVMQRSLDADFRASIAKDLVTIF